VFLQAAVDADDRPLVSLADVLPSAAAAIAAAASAAAAAAPVVPVTAHSATAEAAVVEPPVAALTIEPESLSGSAARGLEQLRGEFCAITMHSLATAAWWCRSAGCCQALC
jgi:hypothetical protein